MLPLPTNARSWFMAYLRNAGVAEEELEETFEYEYSSEDGEFLLLQGGSAGVAAIAGLDDTMVYAFGDLEVVNVIHDIAVKVYKFPDKEIDVW